MEMEKNKKEAFLNSFIIELKRGTLTLVVLSQLKIPQYGYSLLETLVEKGIDIESNTLYPLLRRLEKQEVLTSQWDTTESRPRKYYQRSDFGDEIYQSLKEEYNLSIKIMGQILKEN